jgi:hypothetical protein
MKTRRLVASSIWCAVLLSGCGADVQNEPRGAAPPPRAVERGRDSSASTPREHQAAMLNRIRQSDPRSEIIQRALFNERNELGIILSRNVPMDDIPRLMKSLLTQMAQEFPGQDLIIVAYAPTNPPTRLGFARLDARTRQMTYTSDQP